MLRKLNLPGWIVYNTIYNMHLENTIYGDLKYRSAYCI